MLFCQTPTELCFNNRSKTSLPQVGCFKNFLTLLYGWFPLQERQSAVKLPWPLVTGNVYDQTTQLKQETIFNLLLYEITIPW